MHLLDRPLLSGLVALERHFVTAEELIDAFHIWCDQPVHSLGQILVSQGKLSAERVESLDRLIGDSSLLRARTATVESDGSPTTTWRPDSTSVATGVEITLPPESFQEEAHASGPDGASARFKPIRLHAKGGLGHVFLADDLELHRQVALKEIRWEAADEPASRERFVAEAKITGNLEHPGIVPVYGLGVHADGRPFYAMRFIQGQTLAEAIKQLHKSHQKVFSSLEFRQLLGRLVSVCNAVAFAHSRGIVHRDLKPSNVMLGPFGETLVVDWGLAKPFKPSGEETTLQWKSTWPRPEMPSGSHYETCEGEIVGTPAYMSPEQAQGRGDGVGPVSDVYSLGAVLYALLTAQSPLGSSASDIVEAVKQGNIVPVRSLNPRIPRPLAAICQKAMAHQPVQRYASALDLGADIECWLADEPVRAFREPWTDRAFRWMRKHRLPVAVASALLVVTSIALAVGYSLVRRERDIARVEHATAVEARDVAQQERSKAIAANQRAQTNAAATREVVDQFLIQIGDDAWANVPNSEGQRLQMVNLAVTHYRSLVSQNPEDVGLRVEAANALRRSANLYRMVGQYPEARPLYDESVAELQKLVNSDQKNRQHEQRLCETLCDRALLMGRIEGPRAAITALREVLEATQQLQAKNPGYTAARQIRARIEQNLAGLLADIGQYDEAITLARSATATQQQAANVNQPLLATQLSAALASVNLGQTLREAGRPADAEPVLFSALERTSSYLQQRPSDSNLRFILARCHHELGLVHAMAAEPKKAIAEIRQAVELLTGLTESFPASISYRRKLGQVLTDTAELELAQSDVKSAAELIKQSISVLEGVDATFAKVPELLASGHRVASEIARQQNDLSAARSHLAEARKSLDRAREINPESTILTDETKRLNEIASSLEP